MSPLLGAIGDSSEYAYRGTLDDVPATFNFTNITGAEPGVAYTTGPVLITGINNKVRVSVSTGASISVNSGIFTSGPVVINNNDVIALYTPTTQGTDADFAKTYRVTAKLGGRITKDWTVVTRSKDITPVPFSFESVSSQELDIELQSNVVTLSGLEPLVPTFATIASGIGSFRKNNGTPVTSATVSNGDRIAIVMRSPTDYSSTNTALLRVGDYTASYSITTRDADTTVNQFNFNNYVNVAISSAYDSNSITLSGADNNTGPAPVPLTATVTGGFLKVERSSLIVRDFSSDSATVFNGDVLTLKINSSPDYSKTTTSRLTVTGLNDPIGVTSTFSVTTRPVIRDTIVDQFQIVDKVEQFRNISTISDPIVISGLTNNPDDFAHIYLTNNADGGEFRIKRGDVVIRDFGTDDAGVRNGDVVDFRITTSPASGGTVLTNVNIAGTDNSDINNIYTQTRTDTWIVQSAVRKCPLSLPTFAPVNNVDPGTLQSITFTPAGYDTDCGVVVNTSNPNSYLEVAGQTSGTLITPVTITLTSSTVSSGSSAPNSIYSTTSGRSGATNSNPQLSWSVSGLPSGVSVQSYSIHIEDLSTTNKFVHWNLTGISSSVTSINLGATTLPTGSTRGNTSWPTQTTPFVNSVGYGGPAPPTGEQHNYRVTVRATLSGSSSVLVKGIEFYAGSGTIIPNRATATYADQSLVSTTTPGNNLLVLPGVACTVFMPAGTFSETRTTTVRLTANNNVPTPVSIASTWSVRTRSSNDPTVTIKVEPKSINCGDEVLLTWSSTRAVSVTTSGFVGVGTEGELILTPKTSTTYSITATGPDATTKTSTASVLVKTTAEATIDATDTFIDYNGSVTLFWATSNASSVISNFGVTATEGQITLTNLKATKKYTVSAVSNSGCANSPEASVTVGVAPCAEDTEVDTGYGNFSINYTYANAGNGFAYYFTSASGFELNSPARDASSTEGTFSRTTPSGSGSPLPWGQCGKSTSNCSSNFVNYNLAEWVVPAGVTEVTITLGGAGGGGGGGGGAYDGGNGGNGGEAIRTWPVTPGSKILYAIGPGGQGSPTCGASNVETGFSAGPGFSSWAWYNTQNPNNLDLNLIAWAEGGGGGIRSTITGPIDGDDGRANGGSTGNTIGGGSPGGLGGSTSSSDPCNSNATAGQNGTAGYIYIDYAVTGTSDTWNTLINAINGQFRSSFNRPPTNTEMDFWIGKYITTTATIDSIRSGISASNAYKSGTGAISVCGNTL